MDLLLVPKQERQKQAAQPMAPKIEPPEYIYAWDDMADDLRERMLEHYRKLDVAENTKDILHELVLTEKLIEDYGQMCIVLHHPTSAYYRQECEEYRNQIATLHYLLNRIRERVLWIQFCPACLLDRNEFVKMTDSKFDGERELMSCPKCHGTNTSLRAALNGDRD